MAEALGERRPLPVGRNSRAAEALCPDDAALPLGGPPYWPLVHHGSIGRPSAFHANARVRGPLPHGLRRFRLPAENAAIHRGFTRNGITPTSSACPSNSGQWRRCRLASGDGLLRSGVLAVDPVAFPPAPRGRPRLSGACGGEWCPSCNTTLAREQVIGDDRRCERCGTAVTRRGLEQWFLATTRYAEELLNSPGWTGRSGTDPSGESDRRSEGARIAFETDAGEALDVFTTRPDTLWA